jgi:tripartite motif-containing protein 71
LSFYPVGIAIDSSDNVYISDSENNRIVKLSKNGNYLTQWGSKGASRNQFNNPQGVAIDSSGNVYVVDSGNYRIMKFDSTGTYLTEWGTPGSKDGQFQSPHGIAIDSSGNVYVTDTGNRRIQKFDSTGSYITEWVSPENGDGQFQNPIGIVVDSSNNVYVVDPFYNCVFQFVKSMSPVANFNCSLTSGSTPLSVQFTDLSENATGWNWDFGDGSTSTDQNPIHVYPTEGTYTIKLTATNSAGGDTNIKSNFISVKGTTSTPQPTASQPPVSKFNSNAKSVNNSLIVTFTDTSTEEPTSWLWDFGDGNTSTEQNPTHTYAKPGDYHVTLTVSNSAGKNASTKEVSTPTDWGFWGVCIALIALVAGYIYYRYPKPLKILKDDDDSSNKKGNTEKREKDT